jgi:hypothetical protein
VIEPRLEHQVIKVKQLIDDYRAGRVVIPEFQREYVWRPSRAPRLIDSLYQGFPISSLLLWISADEARARRRDPRPTRAALMSWLIDGQQRVITLSRSLSGDEGIEVVFHPEQQEFALANAATRKDVNWFRLADIWEDESYRQIRRNLPDGPKGRNREARFERVRRILEYEIPVVRMVDHSFDNAVNAFRRINTLGVKLKREDIESAQVAARHTGFIADEVSPFLEQIRRQGFSRINVMHLFRVCAFVARPDGRNRTPLHELDRQDVAKAWSQTKKATHEAMALVRSELGLVNMDILWSGALLVPVIALCATIPPRERDAKAIAGWLAVASLLHRYSVAAETALDQDLRACRANDPIGALLTNVRREEGELNALPDDFRGALVDRGALLGMYVACLHRGVKDLFSGGKVLLQPVVDRHHLLPRAQFPERQRPKADCIANIAFITGATNKSISSSGPEVYLKRIRRDILDSQCVPVDDTLWRVDRAEDFWAARRELLANAFNDYIRTALPNRRVS